MAVEMLLRNSDLKLHLMGLSNLGEPISVIYFPKKRPGPGVHQVVFSCSTAVTSL